MKLFSYICYPDGEIVSRTQKTLALSIASMVNTVLQMLLSMMATRLLLKTEIAVNSQTLLAYQSVAPVLLLGLSNGLYYYLSQNEHRKRVVICESMLIVLATNVLYALFLLLGGTHYLAEQFQNTALVHTLYWMIPYALAMTTSSVFSCVFVFENRLRFNAIYSVAQTMITLLVVGTSMMIFRTGEAMVIAYSLSGCLFAMISAGLVFGVIFPRKQTARSKIQWSSIKMLLTISVPLGVASMVGTLSTNLDKLIISSMLPPVIYAVYTQGARELPLIGTITGAINTVMIVDLTKAAKNKDYDTAIWLFRRTAERTSMLLMPIMVFCWFAADAIIGFLYTKEYLGAVWVFRIYLLYMPIRVVLYSPLLIALGQSKFILVKTTIGLGINAGFSIIFVKLLGAEGAALASILSLYLYNVPANLRCISRETGRAWRDFMPLGVIGSYILCSLPGGIFCALMQSWLGFRYGAFVLLAVQGMGFCIITLVCYKFHMGWTWRELWSWRNKLLRRKTK